MRKQPSKSSSKKRNLKKSSFFVWPKIYEFLIIPPLLALVLTIKIGQLPQVLLKRAFLLQKRGRGRPRTQPLSKIYWKKVKRANRQIPTKTKWIVACIVILLILVNYSLAIAKLAGQLPSPTLLKSNNDGLTTQIFDRSGKLLYQFYEGKNRKLIKLDELPPYLIQATIAIEDKHFFAHPGVDLWGITRAARDNLRDGKMEGGSTLTQQLIKNTLLTPDKTVSRKIKEIILAFWAEKIYSKEEILQMYFNEVPYGGPAWGVEAASQMYFGKSAHDLSLSEAAYLTGLPAAPTTYSPYGISPDMGKQRQLQVLDRMVEDGYITKEQASQAKEEKLSFNPPTTDIKAPHFVMYVRSLLATKYGERVVSQGGLQVTTSLDLNIQEMAQKAVSDQIDQLASLHVTNGAAMITDTQTGQILAMVGSKDYFDPQDGNFNVALAIRSPGSSIKPATYAAAFKVGFSPGTVLLDTPITFSDQWGNNYSPGNYDGRFHGPVSIRTALGSSYNIPAVKMLSTIGVSTMLQTAKDLGITTFNKPNDYGLSLTLGGAGVKMIDMMTLYGVLASGGVKYQPQAILTVTDSHGHVLEDDSEPDGHQALSAEISYLLTSILADNGARTPAFGPNSQLKIDGHTVAVKTGTSDVKKDNWTFGYTPKFVVGVWVGNNDNSPMDPQLSSGITGAAPIWHQIMTNLLKDQPDLAFQKPTGVVEAMVDGHKDLVINGQASKSLVGVKKVMAKDEITGTEKEVTTYTDSTSPPQ
ncbi:penicillin-binding protein [Candidatus Daviesbacteria bacterium]|nr:penicillin-binding protein [Candidatus Daviesbacteria bacterium]